MFGLDFPRPIETFLDRSLATGNQPSWPRTNLEVLAAGIPVMYATALLASMQEEPDKTSKDRAVVNRMKGVVSMSHHREIAYVLLRVTVGVLFLFSGIGKLLKGVDDFAFGMMERFADSPLPSSLVELFVNVLPFAEVAIGTLIVLGLFNIPTLTLAGLLILALAFGAVVLGDPPTVAHNFTYALGVFVLLWSAEHNAYSLGRPQTSK